MIVPTYHDKLMWRADEVWEGYSCIRQWSARVGVQYRAIRNHLRQYYGHGHGTRVGQGPGRDGEVGRFPVAEAATSVGHGPFGTVKLPGLPLQKRLRVWVKGPLGTARRRSGYECGSTARICLSAASCVVHPDDLCRDVSRI